MEVIIIEDDFSFSGYKEDDFINAETLLKYWQMEDFRVIDPQILEAEGIDLYDRQDKLKTLLDYLVETKQLHIYQRECMWFEDDKDCELYLKLDNSERPKIYDGSYFRLEDVDGIESYYGFTNLAYKPLVMNELEKYTQYLRRRYQSNQPKDDNGIKTVKATQARQANALERWKNGLHYMLKVYRKLIEEEPRDITEQELRKMFAAVDYDIPQVQLEAFKAAIREDGYVKREPGAPRQ